MTFVFAGCAAPADSDVPKTPPAPPEITTPVVDAPSSVQGPVLSWDSASLTNTQLAYYYWSEYFLYLQLYRQELPATLDTAKPLDAQMYDESATWQDYFLSRTLETVEKTMAMVLSAQDAGFSLPPSYQASLTAVMEEFSEKALALGFSQNGVGDLDAYFQDSYGPDATEESFTAYLQDAYLAAAYSDQLYGQPTFSQEEIEGYFQENAEAYKAAGLVQDSAPLPTIRTILFPPQEPHSEAQWQSAHQSAQTLYDTWRADGGLESDFSALASGHSQDKATSSSGGLQPWVSPQDLSGDLSAWVFDEARQPGDSTVAPSDDGWVIAYFVDRSVSTAWQTQCELDLRNATYDSAFAAILKAYPMTFQKDLVDLPTPNGLYPA